MMFNTQKPLMAEPAFTGQAQDAIARAGLMFSQAAPCCGCFLKWKLRAEPRFPGIYPPKVVFNSL